MKLGTRRVAGAAVAVLASFLSVCGGKSQPAAPAESPAPPPVTTPPAPQATPDALFSCHLGDGSTAYGCQRTAPSFLNEVDQAINKLAAEHPEVFDLSDQAGEGGFRVVSPGQYYVGVMRNLQEMGFCANFDGEEMQVKIIQEGKEPGQGVGYLDDGTMIVVEGGVRFMDATVPISVTRVLQTVAGRMIFAQPRSDAE